MIGFASFLFGKFRLKYNDLKKIIQLMYIHHLRTVIDTFSIPWG